MPSVPQFCPQCHNLPPSQPYPKLTDLSKQHFSRLVVRHFAFYHKKKPYWCCLCDCGNPKIAQGYLLTAKITKSCGCLQDENNAKLGNRSRTHGMSDTRLYGRWHTMIQRCTKPYASEYKHYGARGITVCQRWQSFEHFFTDMGVPPPGTSLERRDNNGPYAPENCYWATTREQSLNRSDNHHLTYNNTTLTVTEWAEKLYIPIRTLQRRIILGWDDVRALTTPINHRLAKNSSDLTAADVQIIRQQLRQGERKTKIAKHFNVSAACIADIDFKRTWKWLREE